MNLSGIIRRLCTVMLPVISNDRREAQAIVGKDRLSPCRLDVAVRVEISPSTDRVLVALE